jgi:hypothetical protein
MKCLRLPAGIFSARFLSAAMSEIAARSTSTSVSNDFRGFGLSVFAGFAFVACFAERHDLGVLVHRILSRHTVKDFFYRSGLKVKEDEALQENPKFWEMIEAAKTSAKT